MLKTNLIGTSNKKDRFSHQITIIDSNNKISTSERTNYSPEIIELNPITSNTIENEQQTFISKKERTRLYIVYSFTGFCVLIIILLALKRL